MFKSLFKHRYKSLLVLISSVCSITSIFLITSISNGMITMYSSMLKSDGEIIITQKGVADTFFSDVDLSLKSDIEGFNVVQSVSGMIVGAGSIDIVPIAGIYGTTQNMFSKYKMIQGTHPKSDEVMIGKNIYELLDNTKEVEIFAKKYRVSGVYESDIGFENGGVIINIENAQKLFKKSASFLLVSLKDKQADPQEIIEKISRLSKKIDVKSTKEFIQNYNQFKIIKISSAVIAFISFLMGFLAIVSIMSIIVNDRKYEFGIMRAIGISKFKIIRMVVVETSLLTLTSFIIAFVLSVGILEVMKNIDKFQGYLNGSIDINLFFYVLVGSLVMSMVGALIPSLMAAKVDPITLINRG